VSRGSAVDVVVFGTGQMSRLAWHRLTRESPHRVVAFTVDAAWITEPSFCGLPVVPFEQLVERYPPDRFAMFVPLSFRELNRLRVEKYTAAKARGYAFVSVVTSAAGIDPSVEIGENCFIDATAIIRPFSRIGDNCCVSEGSVISHDVVVGSHCFVACAAVVGGGAEIGEQSVLALNCTVLNGVRVAPRCLIGAGAVLTADAAEGGVYVGVPARRRAGPAT